ncbi:murein DD-endopeptidase MepM/ murein hydrolase activator NlpD [Amycolatopsis echigonensis]|uniref:Murein DD-endopeptidase MepM/ murein hydrolase activator NlpD n=1 Tax=Amycolatopsis echigonensis TaxID=2576905 RepID=A0A2N3W9W7_9PSEU|nr:M23 family metallopeptidase [Amycolatopsis niigatensis]PKV90665.1 murein DD-endopeptidase MepM/ murein hydrolase activator NlpD [Amycolatopsis niigatensis]
MSRLRRFAAVAAAVALPACGLTLAAQSTASAAPNFQVPFKCGVTVTAATFSGHNPPNSVDFQKSGITGMPVLASAPGTVTRVANEGSTSYGRWIELDHGGGWRTRYAHLSEQEVSVGQSVGQGKEIGKAGATGGVTGPHLHFEENLNGVTQKAVLNGVAVPYYGKKDFTSKNGCGGNPYSATEVCGSGFSVIDQQALGTAGTAYLLYNSSSKENCVTTLKAVSLGTASPVSAFLEVQGSTRATDSGNFTYYAGPVKKNAGSTCVKWGGSVGSSSYTSPFEHCG